MPEAWLPPDAEENPVRILTPVDASACPTVGANFRRYVTADAMGMAKVRGKHEGEECRWCRNRVGDKHGEDTTMYPGSGLSWRDKTPTPACFLYINDLAYNNSTVYSGEGERRRGASSPASLSNNYRE